MSTAIPLSERLGIPVIKEPLIKEIYGGLWENKLMPISVSSGLKTICVCSK